MQARAVSPMSAASTSTGGFTPAQDGDVLFGGDRLDAGHRTGAGLRFDGQETVADGEGVAGDRIGGRQDEVDHVAQECMRHLDQDPGAVAAVGLGSGSATMVEVLQREQAVCDDLVGSTPMDIGDHRDTARVDF